jgi:predicted nucleic acid-binding Zn ribbon protein
MSSETFNKYDVNCENCGSETIVVTAIDADPPRFCPMCGEEQSGSELPDLLGEDDDSGGD